MDIVRTSMGLGKAMKNASRLREVATIFARHGFAEFIASPLKASLPSFVMPKSEKNIQRELAASSQKDWGHIIGQRLRLIFEELGPGAIKLGQMLSGRDDIFDESFIRQMELLRDKVRPVPYSEVVSQIEKAIPGSIEEVFQFIDKEPIGTASIGVVYGAKLKNGENVVIKVKRPNIDRMIDADFSILQFLIQQIEKVSEEVKYLGISRAIDDFEASLQIELDFNIEALNCQRFKKNLSKHDKNQIFYVPKIYSSYCSKDVIVMERLEGVRFSDTEGIKKVKEELQEKLESGLHLFLRTFLQDGFFHADLHGGNFYYLSDGKIGLIDFGLMGNLSKKSRKNFVAIVYSILTHNFENLGHEFLDVADYEKVPDADALVADIRASLSPYIGLTVQQTDLTKIFRIIMNILRKHQLYLPRDWYVVFRSLMSLDGVGKSIGMDFDIYGIMEDDIYSLVKEVYSRTEIIEDAIWAGKDFLTSSKILPKHLRWFTREWARNGYAFRHINTGYEKGFSQLSQSIVFLGHCILVVFFLISGVFLMGDKRFGEWHEIPLLTWILWGLGVFAAFKGSRALKKMKE